MENVQPKQSGRTVVATASLVASAVCVVGVFVSEIAMNGFVSPLGLLCLSCWVAFPLLVLGLVKVFRAFPGTHGVLLVMGVVVSAFAAASPPRAHSSTSAIGLVTVPFFLLLLYGVAGAVLVCVKTYKQ